MAICYDFDGNELNFGDYDRVYELDKTLGYLLAWKGWQCALLKTDGTILVPENQDGADDN